MPVYCDKVLRHFAPKRDFSTVLTKWTKYFGLKPFYELPDSINFHLYNALFPILPTVCGGPLMFLPPFILLFSCWSWKKSLFFVKPIWFVVKICFRVPNSLRLCIYHSNPIISSPHWNCVPPNPNISPDIFETQNSFRYKFAQPPITSPPR